MSRPISSTAGAAVAVALVALLLVSVTPSAGAEVSTAAELVHLPFDGSPADVSPNGNDAVLLSGATLDPDGQSGGAVRTDGADDLVRLTDPNAVGGLVTQRTISLWFNAAGVVDRQVVYEQGGGVRGLNVYLFDGSVHIGGWNTPASESDWDGSFLSAPVTAGEWHHVALTLDGGPDVEPGAFEALVDGASLGTAPGSQLYGGGTVGIGRNDGYTYYDDIGSRASSHGMAGRVDTVRIWDRVLSAAELAELAGGGPAPNQAPSVDAGADRTVDESQAAGVALGGSVTDDGLPSGTLSTTWTVEAVPAGGSAVIADPGSPQTTVALAGLGAFTFRLTADDGELDGADEVVVTVIAEPVGGVVRMMPVGDSITEARDGPDRRGLPSWRKWFWDLAESAGRDLDMVGSRSGVADGDDLTQDAVPPAEWGVWDWDHDGHYGWRADEVVAGNSAQPAAGDITAWSQAELPDVYLVHIGTNDLAQGGTPAVGTTVADLGGMIDEIRAVRPDARIALSQIITSRPKAKYPTLNDDIAALNAQIQTLAAARSTDRSPIITVDHATGWNPYVDNYDVLHPGVVGQQKIAQNFYDAVAAAGWFDGGSPGGGDGPVDPPAEDPPVEDPPVEDPPVEDPPAEDPPGDAPPGGVSTDDLLLDLPFDGSPSDASGNGNDAVPNEGASIGPGGRSGGALVLDGIDDWAALTDEAPLTGTVATRTVSVWFNADHVSADAGEQVVHEQGGLGRGLAIYVDDGTIFAGGWNRVSGEPQWESWLSAPVAAGQWHHVALVLDATGTVEPDSFAVHLDGVPLGSLDAAHLLSHGTLGIGKANSWMRLVTGAATRSDAHFGGRIDRLRIWDRVLTPAELTAVAASAAD